MERTIENTACEIGAKIIENGGEISRGEESIRRILQSANKKECNAYCLNNVVMVSTEDKTVIKRIRKNDLNLFEIEKWNNVSRCICKNTTPPEKSNKYTILYTIISILLATGSFCIYFGGSIADAIISGIIGIVITYLPIKSLNLFSKTFVQSFIGGILAYIPKFIGIASSPDKIIIGTIMLLIPSITIGVAIRDIMYADTLSGIIELTEGIFTALAISLGFGVVIIFGI